MKKKILIITALVLIISVLSVTLVGCKSSAEKEIAYYEKVAESLEKTTGTLSTLTDELFSKSWTASFVLATTYYRTDTEVIYDDGRETEKYSTGSPVESPITRGYKIVGEDGKVIEQQAGWPVKEVREEGWDYTEKNSTNQFVHFMAFDVDFKSLDNYTVKTIIFEDVSRSDYLSGISKKNYREKFTTVKTLEYSVVNGTVSGEIEVDPIALIKYSTDTKNLLDNGISASDNFRIYTHFMRIESRKVYGADPSTVITREINDATANEDGKRAYWNNYGEDITYDWDNVYGMENNRLTVLYSKGKSKINSLEIYNEAVIAYYTKNNNVDTSLVLKADVIVFQEAVIEFNYN